MNEYDVALKRILTRPGSGLLKALTGHSQLHWLNVELPEVTNRQADLLGESDREELFHIELQSSNESDFLDRMGGYKFAIKNKCKRYPRQLVLYVGDRPPKMATEIDIPDLSFRYHLVDIKDLDGEDLLRSRDLGDNVSAILTRLGNQPGTVRRIVRRIAQGAAGERETAFAELRILAGLRKLRTEVKQEERNMPITEDIMENELVWPFIERGMARGMEKGMEKGKKDMLLGLIEQRFGSTSPQTRSRVESLSLEQVHAASLRIFSAKSVEDLLS